MTKKLITLLLALTMVFACAVPSFATSVRPGTYNQAASTNPPTVSGQFTVTLNIVSDTIGSVVIKRTNLPVTLGSSSSPATTYTVADVLYAASTQYSWLSIYKNANLDPFTNTSTFVYGVKDTAQGNTVFAPDFTNLTKFRGWLYKINGQYPLLNAIDIPSDHNVSTEGPCCAKVHEAYVVAGDVIDLYFGDSTASESTATRTMYITDANYNASSNMLTVAVASAYSWDEEITEDILYYWHVTDNDKYNYNPITSQKVYMKVDNSQSYVTITNGTITKSGVTLSPGDHTIELVTVYSAWYTLGGVYYKFPKYLGTTYTITVE